ncbi:MAG: histidine phosphatase family protein [Cellulosilyticaceae bacterium]
MRIWWMRHGQTVENQRGTYYGHLDVPLTEEGRLALAKYEKRWAPDLCVYSSPLTRAQESARAIGYEVLQVDERLAERHMGIWEGMTYSQIRASNRAECDLWTRDWINYVIPEGESAHMQYERVTAFVRSLEDQGEDALVVCHGGTIQMALAYMLFENIEAFWKVKVAPGGLVVTTCQDGYWYIEEISK